MPTQNKAEVPSYTQDDINIKKTHIRPSSLLKTYYLIGDLLFQSTEVNYILSSFIPECSTCQNEEI